MKENQGIQTKSPFGTRRMFSALRYSLEGLQHASKKEPAFQQELMFLAIMTMVALLLPFSGALKIAIIISHLFVLIVELINSAIESIVDKASPEYHVLAKQSKDMGSAAVLLALFIIIILWGYAIYEAIA